MSIWEGNPTAESINEQMQGTMIQHLGVTITEIGPDFLRGTMPVGPRTIQTMGILHGGASVALAETLGSIGANLSIDRTRFAAVGQEVNANHLRPLRSGALVTGTATPVHLGSRSQVWSIELRDERDRLTCVSRLLMAIIERPPGLDSDII
jgi:1,4-dihydroxy-2-naphthoyl-CoA hydrolase